MFKNPESLGPVLRMEQRRKERKSLGNRITRFVKEQKERLGLSTNEIPLQYFERGHSRIEVIKHFPQITAQELLGLASRDLDPLGKHEHEHADYYGSEERYSKICLTLARGWAKDCAAPFPEVSERLLSELDQLSTNQAE